MEPMDLIGFSDQFTNFSNLTPLQKVKWEQRFGDGWVGLNHGS
jgi:hypothetical protein